MQRRKLMIGAAVLLGLVVPVACSSKDDEGPPPSIGDATYLERPPDTPAATTAP